ncbi:hypothetical protein ACFP3Q_16905 [Nocardioides sp. GCM10027113]|uniref:hypothetical protein n=1 Tax=unclassified Nocardioides TaxID=2615069 RepID=UPI00360A1CED
MSRIQLKSAPSVAVLVLDVVVLIVALITALDPDAPTWMRVMGAVVATVAALLVVRSARLLLAGRRATQ